MNMLKNNFGNLQEHEINSTIYFKIQRCSKSKWDDSINEKCEICENVHDSPQMLFGCKLAQYIWQLCEKA